MATLVLTAVGSAIGGPVGGAIGSIIGQQIDRNIFAPKPREGARLKELEVQTSSYGTQIPAVFGVMRVAGTVIWATDLVERRVKGGGGKGRPATVNYSYSVSMAVALSSRPVLRVGRIWADGNLLRGASGDFKVDTQFRFHTGHADQPPDPLIASAEAAGQCPAHRGLAYAVFEDLQLANYGNRIPSLTFEIFERDPAVLVNDIFEAASGGAVVGSSIETIAGFALSGASAREGISALLAVLPVELRTEGDGLLLDDIKASSASPSHLTIAASENRERFDAPMQKLEPVSRFPQSHSLRYYDRARDFQASVQLSAHAGLAQISHIEFPAVLNAASAKRLVELRHLRAQHDRSTWSANAAISAERLRPGDLFNDTQGKSWRIEEIEHRFGSAAIKASAATGTSALPGGSINPGRNVPSPDIEAGETRLVVLDLPVFDLTDPGRAQIAVFAAGTGSGWRRAVLSLPGDNGLLDIGPTASPAVMGTSINAAASHNCFLIDEVALLEIELLNDAMDVPDRAGSPLDSDAPYIWLDGEYLRYGQCEALGNRRHRFSRLLRGCFRADGMAPSHVAGARFVMLDPGTVRLIAQRAYLRGELVQVEALGLSDIVPVSASAQVDALATAPLPPTHGLAEKRSDGSIAASWVRRSRIDFGWRDGVDQALVEDSERYLVLLHADGALAGEWMSDENTLVLDAGTVSALNLPPAALSFAVRQIGRHARSDPLFIAVH